MASVRAGVVVIDAKQDIRLWTARSEDLWGLRNDEVIGRSFFGLDIGLPVEKLRKPIKTTLERNGGHEEVTLPAITAAGVVWTAGSR